MQNEIKRLDDAVEALRADISVPKSLGIDPATIKERSAVFQRVFQNKGRSIPAYLKIYTYRKHFFERLWREGRSRIEARNLLFFKNIGIKTVNLLAWGERKNLWGKPIEEFIITEAVPHSQTLDSFVAEHCPDRSTETYTDRRDQILRQLGRDTAKIHSLQFFHKDLKWRNLLARIVDEKVELYWIDCPSGAFHRNTKKQQRGRLKDCATLDKIARFQCNQEERLRFLASYLDQPEDSSEVKAFAQAVSQYRRWRFDPKDDEQRLKASHATT